MISSKGSILVIFHPGGAFVEIDPSRVARYTGRPNTLLNPDMTHLKGVPTRLWVMRKGKIAIKVTRSRFHPTNLLKKQKQLVRKTLYGVKFESIVIWAALGGFAMHIAHTEGWFK